MVGHLLQSIPPLAVYLIVGLMIMAESLGVPVPGEIAPPANPKAAKAAVAIVNQYRFVRSCGIHALNPGEETVSCPVARRRGILLELRV